MLATEIKNKIIRLSTTEIEIILESVDYWLEKEEESAAIYRVLAATELKKRIVGTKITSSVRSHVKKSDIDIDNPINQLGLIPKFKKQLVMAGVFVKKDDKGKFLSYPGEDFNHDDWHITYLRMVCRGWFSRNINEYILAKYKETNINQLWQAKKVWKKYLEEVTVRFPDVDPTTRAKEISSLKKIVQRLEYDKHTHASPAEIELMGPGKRDTSTDERQNVDPKTQLTKDDRALLKALRGK